MFKFGASLGLLSSAAALSTHVTIDAGDMIGLETDLGFEFRGVPFADPPARWTSPQPVTPWVDTLDATTDGVACPQNCVDGVTLPPLMCPKSTSESCLFLNVFAPKTDATGLPVLAWIHGGNFKQGAGTPSLIYDGAVMANQTETIVVSINYRLGALGFMASDELGLAGNYGLEDQQMALQWVQDNIAAFGGDPGRVTLFGQSAGAMSVASHLSMPSSEDLFQQAILESEPFALPFRDTADWTRFTETIADFANCTTGHLPGHKDVDLDCLQHLDLNSLMEAQHLAENDIPVELAHAMELFMPFPPVYGEGSSLPNHPMVMFQQGLNQDKPFMAGTVAQEGLEFVYGGFPKPMPLAELKLGFSLIYGPEYGEAIMEHYPVPENQTADARDYASMTTTDGLFDCATRNATAGAAKSAPVYLYHLDHAASFGAKMWGPDYEECWDETCHAGELPFLWMPTKAEAFGYDFTDDEIDLGKAFYTYWGNFAATGDPGVGNPDKPLQWPAWTADGLETLMFSTSPGNYVEKAANKENCDFWDEWGYNFH